jgi:hypothetical protein
MTALAETETADIIAAAYSGIGDKGYQGSDFITPFKKPQGGELLDWQKEFNVQEHYSKPSRWGASRADCNISMKIS